MSSNLIIITGLIYLYIGIEQFTKGSVGMGITYTGYAFSNIGLFVLARAAV